MDVELERLLVSIRRHLHMNPEIGFQEVQTAQFIREMLEMHGLSVSGSVANTGLFVDVEGQPNGKAIGYRADIDALPSHDGKDVEYKSRATGAAHLCGHDAHTAIAIGVALLLHRSRDRLHGTVRVFFQPNEEGVPSGAPAMIDAGILDGLKAAFAVHVDPTLTVGTFGLIEGAATASADRFKIKVCGRSSGHSARPHQAIDTVWIALQIAQSLYQLSGRLTDSRNAAILTICHFEGGEAFNVIPEEVVFGGTLRCVDKDDRELLKRKIIQVAREYAAIYDAEIDVDYQDGAPPVINDAILTRHVQETIMRMYGRSAIFQVPRPSMGAEDFAHYLQHVPGVLLRIGTAGGPETTYPLHDSHFDIDERSLLPASRLMSEVLIGYLDRD